MKPSLAWGMATRLLRTRQSPQSLIQIRPRVLIEREPCKHSLGWIKHLHTSTPRLRDLEAIQKAVLEVSSFDGRMPKFERKKVLADLNEDDRRTARKQIKLAARKKRKEAKAANMQRQKEAGGAELEPLPANVARKLQKKKKVKGKKIWPNRRRQLQGFRTVSTRHELGEQDHQFLSLGVPSQSAISDRDEAKEGRSRSIGSPSFSTFRGTGPFAVRNSLPLIATGGPFDSGRASRGNKDETISGGKMLDAPREDPKGIPKAKLPAPGTNRSGKRHLSVEPTSSTSETRTRNTPDQGQRTRKPIPHLKPELKALRTDRNISHKDDPSDTAAND